MEPAMTGWQDELDRLSSPELHDLAVEHAKRHADARFFHDLMSMLPVAEAGAGELAERARTRCSTPAPTGRSAGHMRYIRVIARRRLTRQPSARRLPTRPDLRIFHPGAPRSIDVRARALNESLAVPNYSLMWIRGRPRTR